MGSWGPGLFDNDAAQDWIGALSTNNDFLAFIEKAFDAATTPTRDAANSNPWRFEEAAAAAEIVAILARHPMECLFVYNMFPGGYVDLCEVTDGKDIPPIKLITKALHAVNFILEDEDTHAGWLKESSYEKWLENLRNVRSRLLKAKKLIKSFRD